MTVSRPRTKDIAASPCRARLLRCHPLASSVLRLCHPCDALAQVVGVRRLAERGRDARAHAVRSLAFGAAAGYLSVAFHVQDRPFRELPFPDKELPDSVPSSVACLLLVSMWIALPVLFQVPLVRGPRSP
jgi:hypothetical protein